MSGYLYFDGTGNVLIDRILGAVEDAGVSYHSTVEWQNGGLCAAIHSEAMKAAARIAALEAQVQDAQAALAQAQATIEVWQREAQSAREEADSIDAKARRWAAEQFRAWIVSPDCGTSQFAERLERGPQPAKRWEGE